MNKILLALFFSFLLFSCTNKSPKETAQTFVRAVYAADLPSAAALTSSSTKTVLDKAKKQTKNTLPPEEAFSFASLTESISGDKAEVKNETIAIPMVKEDGGWKVALHDDLLKQVQDREETMAAVREKWEALQTEYEARLQAIKEYVNYKKGMGALSPKVQLLNEAATAVAPQKEWTRESRLAYVQKQQQLNKVIEEALEPSLAANTDLSLNYFLRISNAGDRIRSAEKAYQQVAEKAHLPLYAPLPFQTSGAARASSN